MSLDIDELKKKIIYRSSYRGSKEMDNILFFFVKEIIENLNSDELVDLLEFISIDDENLYKFMRGIKTDIVPENKVSNLFKNYLFNK